jgi:asparagine synthase (glutamine-hydrolysing)
LLDAIIYLRDISGNWVIDERGATCAESRIDLTSRCFVKLTIFDDENNNKYIWIRENSIHEIEEPIPDTKSIISDYRELISGDGVLIKFLVNEKLRRITITRTSAGEIPLYVTFLPGAISLSWNYSVSVSRLATVTPDIEACKRFAAVGPSLQRNTVIEDVYLLSIGETLMWDGENFVFEQFQGRRPCKSGVLSASAHVVETFLGLLVESASTFIEKAKYPAVELSGGLDSACIAAAIRSSSCHPIQSYGLIQPGVAGIQQTARRNELIQHFSLKDTTRSSLDCRPFTTLETYASLQASTPFDEIYRNGIDLILEDTGNRSIDIVFTGIGGDELTLSDHSKERYDQVHYNILSHVCFGECAELKPDLPTPISTSALLAGYARADMFLCRSIWPKSLFLSPKIVEFCRMLPHQVKVARALQTLTLARVGVSDGFLFPRYVENFRYTFQHDLIHFDFERFMENSLLYDLQIIDVKYLIMKYQDFVNYRHRSFPLLYFYNVVRLESLLRKFL